MAASGLTANFSISYPLGSDPVSLTGDFADLATDVDNALVLMLPKAGGTLTGKLTGSASSTARATLNIPHGTAPTSPSNGDVWTTTAGFYTRVNGTTVGPLGTGGGERPDVVVSASLPVGTFADGDIWVKDLTGGEYVLGGVYSGSAWVLPPSYETFPVDITYADDPGRPEFIIRNDYAADPGNRDTMQIFSDAEQTWWVNEWGGMRIRVSKNSPWDSPLRLIGAAGQGGDMLEVQDSTREHLLMRVTANGTVVAPNVKAPTVVLYGSEPLPMGMLSGSVVARISGTSTRYNFFDRYDTGAASGADGWDSVVGNPPSYSASYAFTGRDLGMRANMNPATTAPFASYVLEKVGGYADSGYARLTLRVPTMGNRNVRVFMTESTSGGMRHAVRLNTSNKIEIVSYDGTTVLATSTMSYPVNTWFGLGIKWVLGNPGTTEVRIYSDPATDTVAETMTVTDGNFLGSGGRIWGLRWGLQASNAGTNTLDYGMVAWDREDWIPADPPDTSSCTFAVYDGEREIPMEEVGGGGGGTASVRPAEVIVASAQAPTAVKDNADYVCTGSADQSIINSAITAAAVQASPITGTGVGGAGKVVLSGGRFNINAPIVLKTGVALEGQGMLTEVFASSAISGAGAMVTLEATSTHATSLSRLWLNGNGNTGDCHGIKYENTGSTYSGRPDTNPDAVHRINNIDITNCSNSGSSARHGIWLTGTSGGPRGTIMTGIRVFGTKGHGVWLDGASDAHISEVQCQVDGSGNHGFLISGGNAQLTTCKAFYSDATGFTVSSTRATLTNCVAQDNGTYGFSVTAGDCSIVGGQADSNSRLSGTGGGLYTNINMTVVGLSVFDRNQTPASRQLRGIVLDAALTQTMMFASVKVPSGTDHVVNPTNLTGNANNVGMILRGGTTPLATSAGEETFAGLIYRIDTSNPADVAVEYARNWAASGSDRDVMRVSHNQGTYQKTFWLNAWGGARIQAPPGRGGEPLLRLYDTLADDQSADYLRVNNGAGNTDYFRMKASDKTLYASGGLHTDGGMRSGFAVKTSDYTATVADHVIAADSSAANRTITLPSAASVGAGREFIVKKADSNASRTVTINTLSSQTIDGELTLVMNKPWQMVTVVSNGTNWLVVSGDATRWRSWKGTQAAYDALGSYDDNTLYVVI